VFRSPGAILVQVGPLALRWYGVTMAIAMAVSVWLATREARRRGLEAGEMLGAAEVALLGGLVGARLYYVLFTWAYYRQDPWRILAIWEGGTAFHGGLVGGLIAGSAYAWRRRLAFLRYLDAAAPSLALGQAIGRWGDFFNEQAFGVPTHLPWGLFISPAQRPLRFLPDQFFHPAFLYESLWSLLGVAGLLAGRRRLASAPGALSLAYLGWSSLGRLWIEALRTDPLTLGPIRVSQVASALGVVLALWGGRQLCRRAPAA
jgi:phosphatidylglycerol---prolipoprotein diacylglyceryl transferase